MKISTCSIYGCEVKHDYWIRWYLWLTRTQRNVHKYLLLNMNAIIK